MMLQLGNLVSWLGACSLAAIGVGAVAQTADVPPSPSSGHEASGIPVGGSYEPRAIRLGSGNLALTPSIGFAVGYTDNVLSSPAASRQSSSVFTTTPRLVLRSAIRAHRYALLYAGEFIRYADVPRSDINNQELAATGEHGLDTRTTVRWRAAALDRYDAVGSTDRTLASGLPDHWRGTDASAEVRYGAEAAQGRFEAQVAHARREYLNNRVHTRAADHRSTAAAARLYNRVSPRTYLFVEYRHARFGYDLAETNLDNDESRILLGAEWQAGAKTSGSVRVGHMSKHYDQVRPRYSGLTWEVAARWQPRTYSRVELSTRRSAVDSTGEGSNHAVVEAYDAAWVHNWTSDVQSRLRYGHVQAQYQGQQRHDRIDTLSVGASYDWRRWARFGVDYSHARRQSDVTIYDYERNLWSLLAEFSLK